MNKTIPAGQFKQGCLAILDDVARNHEEVIITKRGKPVAKLVPIESDRERMARSLKELRSRMKVKLHMTVDELCSPTTQLGAWNLHDEDGEP
jgi:prevent-host-death family protein